jgi:hypothetical protein
MSERPAIELLLGDVLRLRRPHPCGGNEWLVDRLGADIGLRCLACDRHVLLERRTIERRLVVFTTRGDATLSAAVGPKPQPATQQPGVAPDPGGEEPS